MRGLRNFSIFCVSIFFQANAIACIDLTGNYQCVRRVYFWQDTPRVKVLPLKIEQTATEMQWQLGSSFGDWELNGVENTNYKLGQRETHRAQCDDSRAKILVSETFAGLSRMGSVRTVEMSKKSEGEIELKVSVSIVFENDLLDDSVERWHCVSSDHP